MVSIMTHQIKFAHKHKVWVKLFTLDVCPRGTLSGFRRSVLQSCISVCASKDASTKIPHVGTISHVHRR